MLGVLRREVSARTSEVTAARRLGQTQREANDPDPKHQLHQRSWSPEGGASTKRQAGGPWEGPSTQRQAEGL